MTWDGDKSGMVTYTDEQVLAQVTRVPCTANEIYRRIVGVAPDVNLPHNPPNRRRRRWVAHCLVRLYRKGLICRDAEYRPEWQRSIYYFYTLDPNASERHQP